ncbi:MAG: DUF4124 domain-containing protein [Xanthomonadales bacterium]|nr:DUF4124 domain-containing protein [Xanthomonadaceae bacterium]MBN8225402.1 DUF4124 domain-containing protein [Xanthomonadales bacterium]MCA0198384.1 DUF4124 domain-containing protein [Pseudomonadota bacterium]HRF83149.1 DUF4124 domain-containing protein [Pseudoxanthomonas sp.]
MFGRFVICAALAALPATAPAQVFKCVRGKEVSYQSAPCEPGQATQKEWRSVDYAPPSAAELQRIRETEQATRRRDAQLRSGGYQRAGSARVAATGIGRCDEAKAVRDRELYKLGPWRSIKQLRAWDEYVAKACRP